MILSSVSVIPPGLVSLLFTHAAQGPELQTIQLLAERGADFNECVDGCPAIIRLRMIRAPILRVSSAITILAIVILISF